MWREIQDYKRNYASTCQKTKESLLELNTCKAKLYAVSSFLEKVCLELLLHVSCKVTTVLKIQQAPNGVVESSDADGFAKAVIEFIKMKSNSESIAVLLDRAQKVQYKGHSSKF